MISKNTKAKPNSSQCPIAGMHEYRSGGELHQQTDDADQFLTTNQGVAISDNQNSLKTGDRGPTLLEDFVLREKITHFDHERIPERIVHARGSGAHGYFESYASMAQFTKASFLGKPQKRTPVFARFSTVAGGAGSADLPRDVRGFAVKFYTDEGNFDLVGNNIPVFFIQDALKFPDLIHSVKMEADRGFPQAASAHDTFWDFVTLMPESMHMLMWAMSDRAIPRSLRMIEGFGIHTFRFINEAGESQFVKFHWRPKLGAVSVLWDEAVKINGADPDFHRRDLWNAIDSGQFPEWEFSVQLFDQKTADTFDFDILDSTKLIPEEVVPLTPLGKMVLDRNPDNFFAETEQVAFHPGHLVPGIDFSNDPLLQGRLHSYLDTQLSRLGGPNFHEIPINQPKCPMQNFQRDGIARMAVAKGRVNYEPNSLDPASPRETPVGFASFPSAESGEKLRVRSDSFSDHYSQARQFWNSMSETEQGHIVSAFAFELGKVSIPDIRMRMLGHLDVTVPELQEKVAEKLGMVGMAATITPVKQPLDLPPSPSLSLIKKAQPILKGRTVGILVSDGSPRAEIDALVSRLKKEGAEGALIAPKVSGVKDASGKPLDIAHALAGAPSVLFDAVAILINTSEAETLSECMDAKAWVQDAYRHLKVIGANGEGMKVFSAAHLKADDAVVELDNKPALEEFISHAKDHRFWAREQTLMRR